MNAEEYIDYLIDTAKRFEAGECGIGVQPCELATLKAIMKSETMLAQTKAERRVFYVDVGSGKT